MRGGFPEKKQHFSVLSPNLPATNPRMNISVLSLGWEFPPNIEGGLGIAYFGLNKVLSQHVNLKGIVPGIEAGEQLEDPDGNLQPYSNFQLSPVQVSYPLSSYSASSLQTIEKPREVATSASSLMAKSPFQAIFETAIEEYPPYHSIFQYAQKVVEHAHTESIDLIHCHDWMTFLAAFEVKALKNCPVLLHIHSLEFDRSESPWDSWIFELEKKAMEEADGLIAVSQYTREIMINEYEIDPEKIRVVHNGVDQIQSFRHPKAFPETLILYLGRLTFQKGPELFIQMAQEILKQNQDVRFVVGGKGDQLPDIVRYVAEARIGDKVHFTGHLSRQKVYELFAMADIFVMPSISEPFGIVALEAAQFGLPCVISKNSGAAEVFPPSSVADPAESQQWVDAVMGLLQFPEWRSEQAKIVKERVKDLTWDKAAEKVLGVYANLMN